MYARAPSPIARAGALADIAAIPRTAPNIPLASILPPVQRSEIQSIRVVRREYICFRSQRDRTYRGPAATRDDFVHESHRGQFRASARADANPGILTKK
jgi:hypothetical protein